MRLLTGLILTFFLLASSVISAGEKVNFSGKWSLNSDKSLVQGRRTSAQGELTVSQEENNLTINRISQGFSGRKTITEELTLDGEVKDSIVSGKPTKSAVSWSADGKQMTISYMTLFAQNDIRTAIETWKLSEDGKTLFINYTAKSAKGSRKANYVYDKKL